MFATFLMFSAIIGVILSGFKSEAAFGVDSAQPVLGEWSLVTDNTPAMMKDADSARINEVLKDVGGDFKALDLVATQVVSGTNYKALCRGDDETFGTGLVDHIK